MARNKYPGTCYCCRAWVKCASGRVLTDKDPGVKWAQRAAKEARNA